MKEVEKLLKERTIKVAAKSLRKNFHKRKGKVPENQVDPLLAKFPGGEDNLDSLRENLEIPRRTLAKKKYKAKKAEEVNDTDEIDSGTEIENSQEWSKSNPLRSQDRSHKPLLWQR